MTMTSDSQVPTSTRATDRLAMAHDASHYLLVPASVATPRTAADVAALFRASHESGVPLTFRSGGTSLSGQGVTDGVLADTRAAFRTVQVLDGGARVRVQPGATVRNVNAHLARHGRKLGPDPASEIACTIGGVVANNSSGMACGTEQNTYRTLDVPRRRAAQRHRRRQLGADDADERLRHDEPELCARTLAAARPGPRQRAVRPHHPPAVLDEEHHGLRRQRPARPRPPDRHPHPPGRRQRGHAGLHRRGDLPHGAGAARRGHRPRRLPRRCGQPPGRCPSWWVPGSRRSS